MRSLPACCRKWSAIGLVLLTVLGTAGGVTVYLRSQRYNAWLLQDADQLAPYGVVLWDEGGEAELPQPELDTPLVERTTEGRLVVGLTRSDYYFNLMKNEAWVKTHLVTSTPQDQSTTRKLKLLHHLNRGADGWHVVEVEELAIP